jgi:hypothetical protein
VHVGYDPIAARYNLDFGSTFYFNDGVPAADRVTLLPGVVEIAYHGPIAFTTTHWSVVLAAPDSSPAAAEALEKICRSYWWPLYGFVRRQGYSPEEAQDLTQVFWVINSSRRKPYVGQSP